MVRDPICRILVKDRDCHPTCAVFGPNRHMTWLSIHAPTPTLVRLHPPVVRFLTDVLAALSDPSDRTLAWRLAAQPSISHPAYLITRTRGEEPWMFVFSVTPSVVRLAPPIAAFLRDALADLPATGSGRAATHGAATVTSLGAS